MVQFSRYREQLARQLGFIQRSCEAYDSGYHDDAIRIATALRVLIHDTEKSTSLLSRLNAKGIRLLSTCPPIETPDGATTVSFGAMGFQDWSQPNQIAMVPHLDRSSHREFVEVDRWWNQVVWIIEADVRLTRRTLSLTAANKDGGAHVDSQLTEEYETLMLDRLPYLSVERKLVDAHLVILRQMGYEVMHSPELLSLVNA